MNLRLHLMLWTLGLLPAAATDQAVAGQLKAVIATDEAKPGAGADAKINTSTIHAQLLLNVPNKHMDIQQLDSSNSTAESIPASIDALNVATDHTVSA